MMDKQKITNVALAVIIGFMALAMTLANFSRQAEASPGLAPTPVANLVQSDDAVRILFLAEVEQTSAANTNGQQIRAYEWCDVQITTVDSWQADESITWTVQFSNDNTNWDAGPAVVTSQGDATDMSRVYLFGRYARFASNLSFEADVDGITSTIIAECK